MLIGCLVLGTLRYVTGIPFPTAICLLIIVGLLGYIYKESNCQLTKMLWRNILLFEVTLVVASYLSYGEKVIWYVIAYDLAFLCFYLFEKRNIKLPAFEKFGKLGFTFFLGADIPILFSKLFFPAIENLNCYGYLLLKFHLAIPFSYIITYYVERPLLEWGKRMESKL